MEVDGNRVVVTGMGAITPLGQSADAFWKNLVAGKPGIGPMTLCDPTGYPCQISGEVRDFDPNQYLDNRESRRMARFSQLAVAAGRAAARRLAAGHHQQHRQAHHHHARHSDHALHGQISLFWDTKCQPPRPACDGVSSRAA